MTIHRDYYAEGDYNAICDGCASKLKASVLRKDWQGFMKCMRCWEPRHPQDFVRGRNTAEPAPVPFVRGPQTPSYLDVCSLNSVNALIDVAVVDCVIVDYVSPSYDPSITS